MPDTWRYQRWGCRGCESRSGQDARAADPSLQAATDHVVIRSGDDYIDPSYPPYIDSVHNNEYLEFGLTLAQAAGEVVMGHFRNVQIERKPDGSEVTAADRNAERRVRELIAQRFPDHSVLGEEEGGPDTFEAAKETPYCWVIDPLDGTAGFTMGIPLFGVLIGLLEHGHPVAGVVHMPAIDETVFAARGAGCWFRSKDSAPSRVRVSDPVRLEEATITTGALYSTDVEYTDDQPQYRVIDSLLQAGKYRFVIDCYQHSLVARGRSHAAIDTVMSPWDTAALVPCIEEAGGVATTLMGDEDNVVFGGSLLTSCDRDLHNEILDVLKPTT